MSDVMLLGVLGMPLPDDPAQLDAMTWLQFRDRARQAAERIAADADEIENLRAALKWYADGEHFTKADPDAWDTVSGEPQNWWCDEAGTAMVEDGSLAGMVLAGELTGAQLGALEDGEVVKA